MSISSVFIRRPVATTLLAAGLALAGVSAFFLLPVSPNPNIDLPTISVSASMAGASPETMSTTVATPLERHLGSIASVTEMTSSSSVGSTRVTLQFNISRDIDGAARDVQAAISAARVDLPAALRSNPTYRKANPADLPILTLAMTSKTLTPGQIYDQASNLVQQKLSQVTGVGEVDVNGSSLPAVRIELNPTALFKYGIGLEDVRAAVSAANANSPKGTIDQGPQGFEVHANDSATNANAYRTLIVAYRDNAAVRLDDLGTVTDDVENVRNFGYANGQPAVLITVTKMPGANVIDVADRLRVLLPEMQAELPKSIDLSIINDSTISIRNSLHDVEWTLVIAIICVIFVVFLFLRNFRASLVPSVAVPLSLLGTFGIMYLAGFSLDNFSLMALVVSTGFVVDDAIVMLENVTRHRENGQTPLNAALAGAAEVSFTVLSMSMSLVAVFIPVLLLGGIVGRLFHEFALTVTIAIMMSLIISLTVTPMMCAYLPFTIDERNENLLMRVSRQTFDAAHRFYGRTLSWALDNPLTIIFILFVTIGLNFYLFTIIQKGFFPVQDEGRMQGGVRADQSISFQLLKTKFIQFANIIHSDPAVAAFGGYAGGGGSNTGFFFVTLKPPSQRGGVSTDEVIDRLRPKLNTVAGAQLFLQAAQQIRAGGRASLASYQYTLQGDSLDELNTWAPKITDALENVPELEDVNTDQQSKGLEIDLKVDRATAMRLGINPTNIDNTLYDAFGQRAVSTIYEEKNQYEVIMEVAPQFWQNPDTLKDVYVSTSGGAVSGTQSSAPPVGTFNISSAGTTQNAASNTATKQATTLSAGTTQTGATSTTTSQITTSSAGTSQTTTSGADTTQTAASVANNGAENAQLNAIANSGRGGASTGSSLSTAMETMVPLSAFSQYVPGTTPLAVNHQGAFVATTISFNLPDNESINVATDAITRTMAQLHVPISIHGEFAGTASLYQRTLGNEPLLILSAIITIYIVLGVLYESYVHPLTILSSLPSAGVGAVLALLIFRFDFSLIALIGVLLLIGFVKKNAIIMIDFAIDGQKQMNLTPRDAIYRACLLRFRPIMMTTMAAILGGLPLAIGLGEGYELRQPLGISIVGGLILSQSLTLYTTPVVYLYLDRWRLRCKRTWERWYNGLMGDAPGGQAAE